MTAFLASRRQTASLWPYVMMLAGVLMAVAVFTVTQSVKQREARLRALNTRILSEQQTIRILDAEWAYLTRPQRLEELMSIRAAANQPPPEKTPDTAPKEKAEPAKTPTPAAIEPAVGTAKIQAPEKVEKPVVKTTVKTEKTPEKPVVIKATQAKTATTKKEEKDIVWPIEKLRVKTQHKTEPAPRPAPAIPVKHGGIARPILE